jgi:hypothetical protein
MEYDEVSILDNIIFTKRDCEISIDSMVREVLEGEDYINTTREGDKLSYILYDQEREKTFRAVLSRERMRKFLRFVRDTDDYDRSFTLNYKKYGVYCSILRRDEFMVKLGGDGFKKNGWFDCKCPISLTLEDFCELSDEVLGETLYDDIISRFDTEIEMSESLRVCMNHGPDIEFNKDKVIYNVIKLLSGSCERNYEVLDRVEDSRLIICEGCVGDECRRCSSTRVKSKIFIGYSILVGDFSGRSDFVYCSDCILDEIEENYGESIREEVVARSI